MLVVDLAVLARQPEALTRVGESAFAYSVHTLVVDADPDVDGRVEAVRACLYFLSYLLALPLIPIPMVINAKQTIEFFHKSTRYRFRPSTDRSSLKYLDLYNVVLNKNKEAKP